MTRGGQVRGAAETGEGVRPAPGRRGDCVSLCCVTPKGKVDFRAPLPGGRGVSILGGVVMFDVVVFDVGLSPIVRDCCMVV